MDGSENRWRPPSIIWILLLFSGGLLFVIDVIQIHSYDMNGSSISQHIYHTTEVFNSSNMQGFLIKTPGCRIPDMDPFDPSIQQYIEKEPPVVCNDGIPPLMESNLTSIYLSFHSLSSYGIEDLTYLKCCYTEFWRKIPKKNTDDNAVRYAKKCVNFHISAVITGEFIRVTCKYNSSVAYKDFFAFVPLKNTSEVVEANEPNVLILGIDAVSRLNFHRQMPKTVKVLEKIDAVPFYGFNKVGDNTFPNLIPVLTGLSEQELIETCWNGSEEHFDRCPFIWKHYKRKGFVTSYAEDAAWMGLFNYLRNGFKKQPTDYYWRTFNYVSEHEIGNNHKLNANRCVGGRQVYVTLLDYVKKFTETMYENVLPYFAFFWEVSLSHDFLNTPQLGDVKYATLLEKLHLKNTVLILMSDHGIRWGGIRSTFQGMTEERLPILYVVLPKTIKEKQPHLQGSLLRNSRSLVTPFDIHETLKDLLHPYDLTQNYITNRFAKKLQSRGYSLFEPIPKTRTCESAHIDPHWCTCQQSSEIDKNDVNIRDAANFVVNHINNLLEGYAQCASLYLNDILNARVQNPGGDAEILKSNKYWRDYTITLSTKPGDGIFEVTVRQQVADKINYNITGTISRINLYGEQSACISDFHLKLYCYCEGFF